MLKLAKAARTRYIGDIYLDFFEEYKCTTLNLRLLWTDMIITMDEEHIKFVLATGFNHFWRGRRQKERLETFLGDGIFNRDDEHRALARPYFARDRTSDFELFEKYSLATISVAAQSAIAGVPVEVQDLYSRFSIDSAAEFLFGEHLDTLHGSLPVAGKSAMSVKGSATDDDFGSFVQAFERSQEITTNRARRGYFWPVKEIFKDEAVPHAEIISRYLEPIVSRALAHKGTMKRAGLHASADQNTFLEYLTDSTEDPKVIRDQLLNILLASRDTTSCLLTYVTYFMAMHPQVTRKMRAEVLEHCGRHGAPTFDNIKSLRYVHAAINETLRLFPPVPINIRESRENGVLLPNSDPTYPDPDPQPLYFPGSTIVMYFPMHAQRNKALWGPDADEFDPDRWLDERLRKYTDNPMMYTPFSGGPRICLGQNYARNEASYFLVRLLQEFDTFTLASDVQPEGSLPPSEWKTGRGRQSMEKIWPAYAMTLFVKGGLWVRLGKAADGN
ncbi:hypothetical protein EW026_g4826 [Hermanssonia centrifuga]|uniref:Cytochrome P450 n=1 Tax=Hermanssonia centrifuga TaxID=98765 RepID=A0A4S4KKH2_9APHY|nr:hypothetical protein EW026_g4826 [Hermanssonia centrifuga]